MGTINLVPEPIVITPVKSVQAKKPKVKVTPSQVLFVAEHPEVKPGDFTKIKDSVDYAVKTGVGLAFLPDSKAEKAAKAKYDKFRIFDSIEVEERAREILTKLELLCKKNAEKFGLTEAEAKANALKTLRTLA